jgi:alpha-glucuronidase
MAVNGRVLPAGVAPPDHDLAWYKVRQFRHAPGHPE